MTPYPWHCRARWVGFLLALNLAVIVWGLAVGTWLAGFTGGALAATSVVLVRSVLRARRAIRRADAAHAELARVIAETPARFGVPGWWGARFN